MQTKLTPHFFLRLTAFAIILYWALQNLSDVGRFFVRVLGLLAPFLLGLTLAFVLNVPMRAIEKLLFPKAKGRVAAIRRPLGILLTLVLVVGVIFVVMFQIVPELGRTIDLVRASMPRYFVQLQEGVNWLAARYPELRDWLMTFSVDWVGLSKRAFDFFQNYAGGLLGSAFGTVMSIFSGMFTGVLTLVFALYTLSSKESLARQSSRVLYAYLPEAVAGRTLEIARLTSHTFASFLTGQCLEALILGVMFLLSMSILGFPYALMISVLIAFTALIPIFGAFIGCAVGAFLILMVSPTQAMWFVVLFLILQQIEGNLIYPRVVGSSIGLPSIWVLFAVTVGGGMLGIAGMLLCIPICSILYALLRQSVSARQSACTLSASKDLLDAKQGQDRTAPKNTTKRE